MNRPYTFESWRDKAEGGGFEPPVRGSARQFSKLLVSATHPSFLKRFCWNTKHYLKCGAKVVFYLYSSKFSTAFFSTLPKKGLFLWRFGKCCAGCKTVRLQRVSGMRLRKRRRGCVGGVDGWGGMGGEGMTKKTVSESGHHQCPFWYSLPPTVCRFLAVRQKTLQPVNLPGYFFIPL